MTGKDKGFVRLGGPGALGKTPWTSSVVESPFAIGEVSPSWGGTCPAPARLRVELRARLAQGWSPWYVLGLWAPGQGASLEGQEDEVARVATDTLVLKQEAWALEARVGLEGPAPAAGEPVDFRYLCLAWSGPRSQPSLGQGAGSSRAARSTASLLPVPGYSQMLYGPGKGWCSPTCLSMVFAFWEGTLFETAEAIEDRITRTAAAVWDSAYEGCGNWAFNAAYAASLGYEAQVRRFSSLGDLEPWIEAGIPLVLSVSWDSSSRPLPGAALPQSKGHLCLLVGFDAQGNPVINDPAAPSNEEVRRTYPRAELEARWLEASDGTTYLIWPQGQSSPE